MYKKTPKKVNRLVGYRTRMSKKNIDTWNFANKYCGKLWLIIGTIMFVPSIIIQIPFVHSNDNVISNVTLIIEGIQLALMLGSVLFVEKALKRTFDKDGNRR